MGGFISAFKSKCGLTIDSAARFDSVLSSFDQFVRTMLADKDSVNTDIIVAGYDWDGQPRIAEYSLLRRNSFPHLVNQRVGLVFKGQRETIDRILNSPCSYTEAIKCHKVVLGRALREMAGDTALCKRSPSQLDSLYNMYSDQFVSLLASVPNTSIVIPLTDKMYLQDAIDYARFLIRISIDFQRFTDGTKEDPGSIPGVGGDIDIAVVTPSGFEWVSRKNLH
ncbi:MAG: hypothetical protein E4G91_03795 [Candidatus Zixiibacteriota bacterium]|nr:MAG: hypothetical protein E4G91_03795 [candidate division Zixibacteria bacterium]